jgi:hypothetical protein
VPGTTAAEAAEAAEAEATLVRQLSHFPDVLACYTEAFLKRARDELQQRFQRHLAPPHLAVAIPPPQLSTTARNE